MTELAPASNGKYIVGVDVGGTNVRAGLVDREGRIVAEARRPAVAQGGLRATLRVVNEVIHEALEGGGSAPGEICGIGLGIPGWHNSARGICLFSPNFTDSRNVPVVAPVAEEFQVATYMLNDVKTATLGEYYFGAGRGYRHVVMITLGTGIGGGVIANGELQLGASEGFAEVGHMIVETDGPPCTCGGRGCWEALAARGAMVNRAIRAIQTGRRTALADSVGYRLGSITPIHIVQAAEAGDEVAREVLEETGKYLGVGIVNLIQLYNPEVVIVGGGIAQAGRVLFDPIQRVVWSRAHMVPASTVKIVPAELGDDAGVIGASVLVLQHVQEVA